MHLECTPRAHVDAGPAGMWRWALAAAPSGARLLAVPGSCHWRRSYPTAAVRSRNCACSAATTASTTALHSPMRAWRNSRAVGYQGDSSVPSCQRQSGANGSRIHTGLPRAPARWATLVSTVMTRLNSATSAAVSSKLASSASGAGALRGRQPGDLLCRGTLLQRAPVDAGQGEQRRQRSQWQRTAAVVAVRRVARPGNADGEPLSGASQRGRRPGAPRRVRAGGNVRRGHRVPVRLDSQHPGQRQERQLRVDRRQRVVRAERSGDPRRRAEQCPRAALPPAPAPGCRARRRRPRSG